MTENRTRDISLWNLALPCPNLASAVVLRENNTHISTPLLAMGTACFNSGTFLFIHATFLAKRHATLLMKQGRVKMGRSQGPNLSVSQSFSHV